jgi:protein gp37
MSRRLKAMGAPGYENDFKLTLQPSRINQPLKRKKPTIYFVNSMSDLFHNEVPFSFIDQVFDVIRETPQHTYQILTKRASRMRKYFSTRSVPENAWIGVSVEDRKYGLPRIDELRKIKAKVRFLSIEPLLEDLGRINLVGIHWVIVGGESGPKARPMQPEWVSSVQKQCYSKNIAFFFKQWGVWGADGKKRNKKANGRKLYGSTYNQYPATAAFC